MLHLIDLGVGPLPVEAKHRDSEAVDDIRIELAVRVVVRDHLAAPLEADRGAVVLPVVLFQLHSVSAAGRIAVNPAHEARARLSHTTTYLDVVSARKIELLVVEPPRHVDVHSACAILVVPGMILHRRDVAGYSATRRVG